MTTQYPVIIDTRLYPEEDEQYVRDSFRRNLKVGRIACTV